MLQGAWVQCRYAAMHSGLLLMLLMPPNLLAGLAKQAGLFGVMRQGVLGVQGRALG